MIDANVLLDFLSANDYKHLFRACGFQINGESGPKLSGVLGPKELGEGNSGNFSVDLEKGLVRDFGSSGYGGDVISVVQDVQGLDFPEALNWIVEELNLDLSTLGPGGTNGRSSEAPTPDSEDESSPEPVVSLEQVERWHKRLLGESDAAQAARSYLTDERGLTEDVLVAARIGLAHRPDNPRAKWWIMIPVPDRENGEEVSIAAFKRFAFNPSTLDWKRDGDKRKIPRNAGPAVLYDLVPSSPKSGPVVVCEGELDALSALSHGFNAVTGTAGAHTFKREWAEYIARLAPTGEQGVVVSFDGDAAGSKGAKDAARHLHEADVDVRVASLPEDQDVNDLLVEGGRSALSSFLSDATPYPPPSTSGRSNVDTGGSDKSNTGRTYEPFPMEALPEPVRKYIRESANALGKDVPPAMVAIPTLSVLSGSIGDAARLRLKDTWSETTTLWTVLVAPSGSTKSPAFSHAVRPILRLESEARDMYERALAEWKAQEDPDEREKPVRTRYRTGDATPEAIVKILEENPRGVLLARDELGAWLGAFDRYSQGAADLQFWSEVWQGTQASRDRVGDGNTTVDTPAVPLTGTIQPGVLKEKLCDAHFDSGFAARLILCSPPTPPKRWTDADVSEETQNSYARLLDHLHGIPRGSILSLSPEAKERWVAYFNRANASLEMNPDGPGQRAARKGVTHTARLAIILHLCRQVSQETGSDDIDKTSMEMAIRLGEWLTEETLRVYSELKLDHNALSPIQRFLRRLPDEFETSDAKAIAEEDGIPRRTLFDWLDRLQKSGDTERLKRGHYRKT